MGTSTKNSTDNIKEHFKARAHMYNRVSSSWVHNETILNTINSYVSKVAGETIDLLEVGAGTGVVSQYLLNNCNKNLRIVALDISPDMLQKIKDPGITVCNSSAESIPYDNNSFDVVVSRQCLHYVQNLDDVINEIRRVLKPKGIFVLSQIIPFSIDTRDYWKTIISFRQPLRKNYYTEDEWINTICAKGFIVEELYNCYHIASVKNWIKKYSIIDPDRVKQYCEYYLDAPVLFKTQYDVVVSEDDITSKSFWTNIMFRSSKRV